MTNQETLLHLKQLHERGELQGVFRGIPNEVYHDPECPGVSSTSLKHVLRSIPHYLHSLTRPDPTDAMRFGSAFHDAVLLPEIYKQNYIVSPKFDRRTKDGKEKSAAFDEDNKHKTILDQDEAKRIDEMAQKIHESTAVNYLLSSGEAEISFWWIDEDTGVLCKCRADWLYTKDDHQIVIDIKTTKDATKKRFQKSLVDFSYDLSAAFYLDGISKCLDKRVSTFAYIAIESEAPYDLGLYCLGTKSIDTGKMLYKLALQKYKEYINNPDSVKNIIKQKEFEIIEIPDWANNIDNR